jgi:multiple sugar transport system permease protein
VTFTKTSTATSVVQMQAEPLAVKVGAFGQGHKKRNTRLSWLIVSILIALPSVVPLLWLLSTSFKNYIETQTLPPSILPSGFNFDNYAAVLTGQTFGYIRNSIIVTVVVMILVLLLAVPASYALARLKLKKGRDLQFWIISLRMLPAMAVVVPVYLAFSAIGLTGTLLPIICMLTMVNASFAVWLCTSFFEQIPVEIEEAANLDGLNRLQTMLLISIPLARTGIYTIMGFVFIFAWNELPFALVLSGQASQTLPVFLSTFSSITLINYGQMAAACVIHIIPVIIVTVLLQRRLVEGLSFGAVK